MGLSHSQKEIIRVQFDCLCKKMLREYSRDIERQQKRRSEREVTFSAISETEITKFYVEDEYPSENTYITYLSKIDLYDEFGNQYEYFDEEKRQLLEIKLITKILCFRAGQVV